MRARSLKAAKTSAFFIIALLSLAPGAGFAQGLAQDVPEAWKREFPKTDFGQSGIGFSEILSGGPPRDGIPGIDDPHFLPVSDVGSGELADREPVISVVIGDRARAYPLRVLMWHEIVNDIFNDRPLAVTYCPLCDAAVVFDRVVGGQVLDFGTTGRLRHSDLVMYDRQTESWWQQFSGEGIIGAYTGTMLKILPSRTEAYLRFKNRFPDGEVLVPDARLRNYGVNPYRRYDTAATPFLYRGDMPAGIAPMARVVKIGDQAWSLALLREKRRIEKGGLVLRWEPGQASALDTELIAHGREIGNVIVQRRRPDGSLTDAVHDTTFAFAFHAFHPDGVIYTE